MVSLLLLCNVWSVTIGAIEVELDPLQAVFQRIGSIRETATGVSIHGHGDECWTFDSRISTLVVRLRDVNSQEA